MSPLDIVAADPVVEVGLQFGGRSEDLFPERDPVEFVEHRLVEALDNSIRLRALGLGARMVNILDRQIELVFVVLRIAAIFRAPIGQNPA